MFWRYHGKQKAEWSKASLIATSMFNSTPKKSKKTLKPDFFSPYKNEAPVDQIEFKDLLGRMRGKPLKRKRRGKKGKIDGR